MDSSRVDARARHVPGGHDAAAAKVKTGLGRGDKSTQEKTAEKQEGIKMAHGRVESV